MYAIIIFQACIDCLIAFTVEQVRDLTKKQNMPISIGHYLNNMSKLTDQWTRENFKEVDRQRIYMKDIDCPPIWHDKLREQIPPSVFYLNNSTGEYRGPDSKGDQEQGASRAGDLMSCLPPAMRADNMMCYIGHEGTYTPAHREMCASLGHNLMVETSHFRDQDGKQTKPGSSIWFMTETNDRHLVSEYWLSTLGHDIEIESHFAQINAWKAAPFKTYIVDQRAGDFVLIPPLAPHQVWNRGTRTMKAAWNRTTVETLEMALHEALPRARMVCRDEQYKNKAIIYFALERYYDQLKQVQAQKKVENPQARYELSHNLKIRQLQKDFKRLFALYTEVLLSEMLDPVSKSEKRGQYLPYDSFVTCSYCRCNIFNRFLTCTSCIKSLEGGEEDTYDICMECYAMGRSCACLSKYKWVEQFPWNDLASKHDAWRHLIIDFDGGVNERSPLSLEAQRKNLRKKTLAQVCQEQMKARPFVDLKNPQPVVSAYDRRHPGSATANNKDNDGEEEIDVDDQGNPKKSKSKKTRAEKLPKGWVMEHVSLYPEVLWKVATCTKCERHYSYGSLYRMFDLMPQTVMENLAWECPTCLKICSCGACRRKAEMRPHEPVGTVLGYDTKKVADPRSVDCLVNFGHSNLGWIKRAGDDHPHESRRLNRRIDEAERAKAKDPTLDDNYVDEEDLVAPISRQTDASKIEYNTEPEIAIDPMLLMDQPSMQLNGNVTIPRMSGDAVEKGQRLDGVEERNDADLANGHDRAPIADMTGHHDQTQGFTSNGITYEYPDPAISQPPTFFQTQDSTQLDNGPSMSGLTESGSGPQGFDEAVQKRVSGHQLTQLEQMLEQAKLNDRYISTEAKFTGKSKHISLMLPKTHLMKIASHPPIPKPVRPAVDQVRARAPEILQSDFPNATHNEIPHASKKRKSKAENDDDFASRKRQNQQSSTAQFSGKVTRKKAAKYTEPSSESEAEEMTSVAPLNKTKGPRRLPKYLSERAREDTPSSPTTLVENPSKNLSRNQGDSGIDPIDSPLGYWNRVNAVQSSVETPRSVAFASVNGPDPTQMSIADPSPKLDGDEDIMMAESVLAKIGSETVSMIVQDEPKAKKRGRPKRAAQGPSEKSILKSPPVDPALKSAEENRKAKIKAMQWTQNDGETSSGSDTSLSDRSPVRPTPTRMISKPTPNSIFSRPGSNGKKIKIVAAMSRPVSAKATQKAVHIAQQSLGTL